MFGVGFARATLRSLRQLCGKYLQGGRIDIGGFESTLQAVGYSLDGTQPLLPQLHDVGSETAP
jgi:hypothetical protein